MKRTNKYLVRKQSIRRNLETRLDRHTNELVSNLVRGYSL